MSHPNYQTVKLARGRHVSPDAGVCVMELASMLACESFSDRPRSVSPTIGGFLRAYNDLIDDERRQDLYGCAAEVLGTSASYEVEIARAAHLQAWGERLREARWWRRVMPLRTRVGNRRALLRPHQAGPYAVHSIYHLTDELHASAMKLVRELVDIAPVEAAATPVPGTTREDAVQAVPGRPDAATAPVRQLA